MKVSVVGASGMVGRMILKVLEERQFPVTDLIPVVSERSEGTEIEFRGKCYKVLTLEKAMELNIDIALFSAGEDVSLEWAPKFAKRGCVVIDNSSAWRMDPTKKLVVPEINGHVLSSEDRIIANPNCSTIQLVMVLAPLHKTYKMKRLIVSTYQSVSGTGIKAVEQMENESKGIKGEMAYYYPIYRNIIPHCDVFLENGYTKEEMKLMDEPKKILSDDSFSITATAVRVPVYTGHSESVNVEFRNSFQVDEVRDLLSKTSGVVVQDDVETNTYPMPLFSSDKDEIFVGRIRKDESNPKALNMWIVADNLRKGAATNAIQIAEYLTKKKIVKNY